jgi:iron complex outermembrane recepter protein
MRGLSHRFSGARVAAATAVILAAAAQPLIAQRTAVIGGTVRNAVTGAPLADALLRVVPGGHSCVTGGDGRCRLVVDADQVDLTATVVGFAPAAQRIALEPGASAVVVFELQPSAIRLDPLVALGRRTPDRTASESPVPVDIISSQLLEETGVIETWQQLQRLVPSLNVPHIPIGDNHMRPVTLRGLAPHHVLVLVNGKRRHPAPVLLAGPSVPSTSFTDLSAIPSSAIERIEVLRDGAAAQYGSDAIGGVVNVVLRSGAQRELRASSGTVLTSEGGRSFTDGRHFKAVGTYGVASNSGAHLTVSGEFQDRSGTNRAYPDRRPQYFAGDPGNDEPPRVSSYLGNGDMRSVTAFVTAGARLGGDMEAYAFGGAADRHGVSPDAFFRRPLDPRTVRAIHPAGFLPVIASSIVDASAVAGVKGSRYGWRWDVSSGWGGSRVDYSVRNSNNVSLGTQSPDRFNAGRVAGQQWSSNVDVSRELTVGGVPVGISAGAELRMDRYRIAAGEPDSWRDGEVPILDGPSTGQPSDAGAQGMTGFRPVDEVSAHRRMSAIYLEAEGRPLSRLLLQSAVRAERYSDFGSTSDGKIAARIDVVGGLAVRGSMSTGFRAPALAQQHFSSTRTVYRPVDGINTVLTVRTFPVSTPEAQLLGATPLRPEHAVNRSAGLVLDVPRLPLITLDVYQINITDRIGLRGSVTDSAIIRLFDESGMRGIGGGNYFANAIDTRTRGLDLVASHALLLHRTGVFRMLAGYNRTRTVVTRVAPPPAPLAEFGAALFNRTSRGIIENGQPRETITVTLSYNADRLGLNLHNQRSGPTAQLDRTMPEADQVLRPRWITDARLSYQFHPRMHVALSAANLFDVYPDEWLDFKQGLEATGGSMQGIFRYPGALSPFGMNGRTVYVQFGWR